MRPVHLRIHAAPGKNPHSTSNLYGGPTQPVVPIGDLGRILREATALLESGTPVVVEIVDEPTRHPDFVQVQERILGARLVPADRPYVLSTDGSGLLRAPDGHLARLCEAGMAGARMQWFGSEATHDALVGRAGAWQEQMGAARRLMEKKVELAFHLVVHRGSAAEVRFLRDRMLGLGPVPPTVEIVLAPSAGKTADPQLRARAEDLEGWTDGMRGALRADTEAGWAARIAGDPQSAQLRVKDLDEWIYLDVYGDLSVYVNLRAPLPYPLLPRLRAGKMGTVAPGALAAAAEEVKLMCTFRETPLSDLILFAGADNDALYTFGDVVENVWGRRMLEAGDA